MLSLLVSYGAGLENGHSKWDARVEAHPKNVYIHNSRNQKMTVYEFPGKVRFRNGYGTVMKSMFRFAIEELKSKGGRLKLLLETIVMDDELRFLLIQYLPGYADWDLDIVDGIATVAMSPQTTPEPPRMTRKASYSSDWSYGS